jgi:integrase
MPGPGYDREGDLVFCHEDGSPIRPDGPGRRFERLAKAGGVRVIRFHDLRHTHATLALEAGSTPRSSARGSGIRPSRSPLDVYSGWVPAMHADAAEAIAGLLVSTSPTPG